MRVTDAMHFEIVRIEPSATLREAAWLRVTRRVEALQVMQADQLLGVIGLRDLYCAPANASFRSPMDEHRTAEEQVALWDQQTVGQTMTVLLVQVAADDDLMRAAALMINGDKLLLPVVRAGQVVGMIGRADITQGLLALEHV